MFAAESELILAARFLKVTAWKTFYWSLHQTIQSSLGALFKQNAAIQKVAEHVSTTRARTQLKTAAAEGETHVRYVRMIWEPVVAGISLKMPPPS